MTGARILADYLDAMVHIACRKCDRRGQYRRSSLTALYGPAVPLPGLLGQLAHDCPKRGAIGNEACGVYFPDFAERPRRMRRGQGEKEEPRRSGAQAVMKEGAAAFHGAAAHVLTSLCGLVHAPPMPRC